MLSDKLQAEHARYAAMGMVIMRREDKTPEEKIDFFREMENRYPGIGWGKEGIALQKHWIRRGVMEHVSRQKCEIPD